MSQKHESVIEQRTVSIVPQTLWFPKRISQQQRGAALRS